jgi:hypothetical protein
MMDPPAHYDTVIQTTCWQSFSSRATLNQRIDDCSTCVFFMTLKALVGSGTSPLNVVGGTI